jgi:hypothetical protein
MYTLIYLHNPACKASLLIFEVSLNDRSEGPATRVSYFSSWLAIRHRYRTGGALKLVTAAKGGTHSYRRHTTGCPTQKLTQNPGFSMPGFARGSNSMSFLLGATCIGSFAFRPNTPAW